MAKGFGREPGGIRRLIEQIEQHPAPFAYDWRARFGLSIECVGDSMSYFEAALLVQELIFDPSSHVATLLTEQDEPMSLEARRITDVAMALGVKYERHEDGGTATIKKLDPEKQAKIDAALRAHGHTPRDR